jgi:hypothetical protein
MYNMPMILQLGHQSKYSLAQLKLMMKWNHACNKSFYADLHTETPILDDDCTE